MGEQFLIAGAIGLVFIVVLYFVLVRPQVNRLNQHKDFVNKIKIGDHVLTAGGVVGKVVGLDSQKYIHLEIAEKVVVKMRRSMIYGKA